MGYSPLIPIIDIILPNNIIYIIFYVQYISFIDIIMT